MRAWQKGLMWVGGVAVGFLVIALILAIGRASVSTPAPAATVVAPVVVHPAPRTDVRAHQLAPVAQAVQAAATPQPAVQGLTKVQTVLGTCLPGQTEVQGTPQNSTCEKLDNGRLRCRNICQ